MSTVNLPEIWQSFPLILLKRLCISSHEKNGSHKVPLQLSPPKKSWNPSTQPLSIGLFTIKMLNGWERCFLHSGFVLFSLCICPLRQPLYTEKKMFHTHSERKMWWASQLSMSSSLQNWTARIPYSSMTDPKPQNHQWACEHNLMHLYLTVMMETALTIDCLMHTECIHIYIV